MQERQKGRKSPVLGLISQTFVTSSQTRRRDTVGQCALEKQRILLNHVPADYTSVRSSLGSASPTAIVVIPVLFEGQTKAVIELASLHQFSVTHLTFLEQLTQSIGVVLNTIEATMRT